MVFSGKLYVGFPMNQANPHILAQKPQQHTHGLILPGIGCTYPGCTVEQQKSLKFHEINEFNLLYISLKLILFNTSSIKIDVSVA